VDILDLRGRILLDDFYLIRTCMLKPDFLIDLVKPESTFSLTYLVNFSSPQKTRTGSMKPKPKPQKIRPDLPLVLKWALGLTKPGRQMVYFQAKNPTWDKFGNVFQWKMLVYLWPFGVLYNN
jgi:hypothetical protein